MSKLLVIAGPTGSGKTALSLELAKRLNGEVIAADSQTVYRGMDIGTAKPTPAERAETPHHLLDVVEPGDPFSVGEYQKLAREKIEQIRGRNNLPMLVGGSGLYIDAVVYNYRLRPVDEGMRRELESWPLEKLQQAAESFESKLSSSDWNNRRRLIRALESKQALSERSNRLEKGMVYLGVDVPMSELEQRLSARTDQWFEQGLIEETKNLIHKYGAETVADKSPYREVSQYINDEINFESLKATINLRWRQLAKRQYTWFRRNPDIVWAKPEEAVEFAIKALAEV